MANVPLFFSFHNKRTVYTKHFALNITILQKSRGNNNYSPVVSINLSTLDKLSKLYLQKEFNRVSLVLKSVNVLSDAKVKNCTIQTVFVRVITFQFDNSPQGCLICEIKFTKKGNRSSKNTME